MIDTKVAVGTQVIGNREADRYCVTKAGIICTLIKNTKGEGTITVRTSEGAAFHVERECFDIYEGARLSSTSRQVRKEIAIEEYISNTSKIKYSFKVDEKRRTVKVAIHSEKFQGDVVICEAKCHEDDDWELGIGLQLAYERFHNIIETAEKSLLKRGTAIKIKTFEHAVITTFSYRGGRVEGRILIENVDRKTNTVSTTPFITKINNIPTIISVALPISDITKA